MESPPGPLLASDRADLNPLHYTIYAASWARKFRISFQSDIRRQAVNIIKTARASVAGKTFLI